MWCKENRVVLALKLLYSPFMAGNTLLFYWYLLPFKMSYLIIAGTE